MIRPGTRKRCPQDAGHCFPPCKRLRAELNYAGKTRHGIDDAKSPMSAMKHSAMAKSAIGRGRPYRPSYCRRYRRPMIRFLSANVDAPFVIARDDVRHILRQCHAQDRARETGAGVDSLFGGDASLHFPSCTFQGWSPRCNINSLKNPPVPTEMDNALVRSRPVKLEGEQNRTLNYANLNENKQIRKKNVEVKCVGMENYGKKSTVARDDKIIVPSSPPNTPCRGSKPKSPAHGAPGSNLPFNVMPKPHDTPVLSRGSKRTAPSTSENDSVTLRRLPPYLRASPRLRTNASSSFASFHSPLRPRTINGPMMAQYPSSCVSPIRPRVSRGPSMVPYTSAISLCASPRPFEKEFATPLSNLCTAMPWDESMHHSDICFPRSGQTTPTFSLLGVASIGKRMLSYAAERLFVRIKVQGNQINTSPSSTNSCNPSSPLATSQNSLRKKDCSSSSKLPVQCQVPFRPFSYKAPPSSTRNGSDFTVQGAEYKRQTHLVKNPTNILPGPPKGWEGLFRPKAGEWKCMACFYINPSEAKNCDSCTAFNDIISEYDATAKCDKYGIENLTATHPVSILRNGKSQRHGSVSSGTRFEQDCSQIYARYDSLADDYPEENDMDLG